VPTTAAKMRPTAAETAHACAAEMSTATKVPAAAKMAATAAVTTATMPTASAASSRVGRARKHDRKNNHGQDFEL
jgi:hypothetical protein